MNAQVRGWYGALVVLAQHDIASCTRPCWQAVTAVAGTVAATTDSTAAAAADQQRRSWYAHETMRCFNIGAM